MTLAVQVEKEPWLLSVRLHPSKVAPLRLFSLCPSVMHFEQLSELKPIGQRLAVHCEKEIFKHLLWKFGPLDLNPYSCNDLPPWVRRPNVRHRCGLDSAGR